MRGLYALFGGAFRVIGGKGSRTSKADDSQAMLAMVHERQTQALQSQLQFFEHNRLARGVDYDLVVSTSSTPFDSSLLRTLNLTGRLRATHIMPADHRLASYPLVEHVRWSIAQLWSYHPLHDFLMLIRVDLFLKPHLQAIFNASWTRLTFPFVSEVACSLSAVHMPSGSSSNSSSGGHLERTDSGKVEPFFGPTVSDTMLFVPRRLFDLMRDALAKSFSPGFGHAAFLSLVLGRTLQRTRDRQIWHARHLTKLVTGCMWDYVPKRGNGSRWEPLPAEEQLGTMVETLHGSNPASDWNPLFCFASRQESSVWLSYDFRFLGASASKMLARAPPESYVCRRPGRRVADAARHRGYYRRRGEHPSACSGVGPSR